MAAFLSFRAPFTAQAVALGPVVLLGALATPAHAQLLGDLDPQVQPGLQTGLGIAVASRQLPYAGVDRKNNALPVLLVENRWFRLAGGNADLKLWREGFSAQHSLAASLRVKYDDEGFKASDSPVLAGMDKRKASVWGGGALTWQTPWVQLGAEYVGDLSGESKGQKFSLQADRRFGFGAWSLTPRVKAQWLDKKYVDYYYGVHAHEVTASRALYTGQSATTAELGLRADYAIARSHLVYIDASVTRLPDEIRQSPIVSRKDTSRLVLGYMYRF